MTTVVDMNAVVLRRSRHLPEVGDIFVLNMQGKQWVAGRVIKTDVYGMGPEDGSVLLYFYRLDVHNPSQIDAPIRPDLLVPPVISNVLGWRRGFYLHVRNEPLLFDETLSRHVFDDRSISGGYRDEYARPAAPPRPNEPCGHSGLWSYRAIDDMLSEALDLTPKSKSE
jgi:hypothetical protein